MKNIKLTLSYNGTRYYGWQKSAEGPSIEETIQKPLETILQQQVTLQAASRTDRGVHAHGQVVNFFLQKEFPLSQLKHALNSLLPSDIAILNVEEMHNSFHPTLDAKKKRYEYLICTDRYNLPFQPYSWYCPYPLSLQNIEKAIPLLLGTHDFSSFCNVSADQPIKKIRQLDSITMKQQPHSLFFAIEGKSFLYKMVRTLIGTLIDVGKGKIDSLPHVLKNRDRTLAGTTAPANGLTLKKVFY